MPEITSQPGGAVSSPAQVASMVKLNSWDQPAPKPTAIVGGTEAIEAALAFGKSGKTTRQSVDLRTNFQAKASVTIDVGQIFPGNELYFDDYIHLFRSDEGQLWLRPRSASSGLFTKLLQGEKYAIEAEEKIFFGERQSQSMILEAALPLAAGESIELAAHRTVGRDRYGTIYIMDDGCSLSGTYIKTVQANTWMAVQPGDNLIHLGIHGIYELNQPPNDVKSHVNFVRPGTVCPIDTTPQTKLPVAIKISPAPSAVAQTTFSLAGLRPGCVRRVSAHLSIKSDLDGRLFAASCLLDDGIFVRVKASKNIYLRAHEAIYIGKQRFDAEIRHLGARLTPGSEVDYSAHRVIGKDRSERIYVRDDGASMAGTFIKQQNPGEFVEILASDEMVHLGPYGQIKIIRA